MHMHTQDVASLGILAEKLEGDKAVLERQLAEAREAQVGRKICVVVSPEWPRLRCWSASWRRRARRRCGPCFVHAAFGCCLELFDGAFV